MHHYLDCSVTTGRWDNALRPRLTVSPGDTLTLDLRDSSNGQARPDMTSVEWAKVDKTQIHGLTGPVAIKGAEPGDQLVVDILHFEHHGWGWTSINPDLGLLDEDFSEHYFHVWKLEGEQTRSMPGVTLDLRPFCGIIGVQRAETGQFRTRPPGAFGGNIDVKHLTAGSRLFLPIATRGAGLCVGDAHAAQGDGEVCINALEAPMQIDLKVDLIKQQPLAGPYALTAGEQISPRYAAHPFHTFIESDANSRLACQRVVRRAIDYLCARLGLTRENAYVLCSVVLDLKISQLVNVPMTTIAGYLPEAIFNERQFTCY